MTLKEKVTKILIKNGYNKNDVNKMIETHFDAATKIRKTAKEIANHISVVY